MDTTLRRLDGIWTLYYAPEKGGRSEDFRADMLEELAAHRRARSGLRRAEPCGRGA